ncbi:hypothetical protein CDAR_443411 [Caerostris darwini]|uniref:Uncharacterized protein n=1 Tax=Caerostris darwini TaxID=1538125 RepID=A0AAV4R403_9ARAC|nr:hypothetical protein CDAR_443411 [Caerostris darwini]
MGTRRSLHPHFNQSGWRNICTSSQLGQLKPSIQQLLVRGDFVTHNRANIGAVLAFNRLPSPRSRVAVIYTEVEGEGKKRKRPFSTNPHLLCFAALCLGQQM